MCKCKKKRITSVILIAMLVSALFLTSCGKAEDGKVSGETDNQADTQAESTFAEQNAAESGEDAIGKHSGTEKSNGEKADDATTGKGTKTTNADGQTVYTYEDISVTIPVEWEGKYMIQESEDGVSFFQTASHEKAEGLGFLCGFYRADNMVDQSIGAMQLAYTDDTMYYYQEPTDVNCYYEDEQIVEEYSAMMEKTMQMRQSLRIDKADVHYDAQEYHFPMSQKKQIGEELLWNMDNNALWIARNEIFARRGRKFDNVYLQNYFESCSWYEGTIEAADFKEDSLTEIEKLNLDLIKAEENKRSQENPYPKAVPMAGSEVVDLNGDGTAEKVSCRYKEDVDNWEYEVNLCIDDMVYDLTSYFEEVYFLNPHEERFYITDIYPDDPGYEIAVMDYGPSHDLVTYFFNYDSELHYLGAVSGFPFKQEQGPDGFAMTGMVMGMKRVDIIHTCYAYVLWYYDQEQNKLISRDTSGSMVQMEPDGGHKLNKDLILYQEMDTRAETLVLPAQDKVFFLETDGEEWIKVKGKDGVQGYMHCNSERIDNMTESPQELFSDLQYYD